MCLGTDGMHNMIESSKVYESLKIITKIFFSLFIFRNNIAKWQLNDKGTGDRQKQNKFPDRPQISFSIISFCWSISRSNGCQINNENSSCIPFIVVIFCMCCVIIFLLLFCLRKSIKIQQSILVEDCVSFCMKWAVLGSTARKYRNQ